LKIYIWGTGMLLRAKCWSPPFFDPYACARGRLNKFLFKSKQFLREWRHS